MCSRIMAMGLLLCAAMAPARGSRADEPQVPAIERSESWQAVAIQGQRVGYGHERVAPAERDGETVVVTDLRIHTAMKRFNGKITIVIDQHIEERLNGELLSFRMQVDNPPASRIETEGEVSGETLTLRTTSAGSTTTTRQSVPAGVKSPVYADRLIDRQPLAPGESRTLQVYDPQLASVVELEITGRGSETFQLPDGSEAEGTRVDLKYLTGVPGLTVEMFLDEKGGSVLSRTPLIDTTIWTVSREEALRELPEGVDLGLAALIEVEPPLVRAHETRVARYRVRHPKELDASAFPGGDSQSAKQIDRRTVEVEVRSLPVESVNANGDPGAVEEEFLAASSYANIDDPEVRKLAERAAPEEASPVEIARAAERLVHSWLTGKNMSSNLATASEVARTREGDCSEHAVLLAALLRARGVPSRVAVGLVYWEKHQSFAGHVWTEARLGDRWVPLDATLSRPGVGAAHIKLGESSLADGDGGLLLGAISAWRLLDDAEIELLEAAYETP